MTAQCEHDQGTELEDTKKGVFKVCKACGYREKVDSEIVIEKVVVPEVVEKQDIARAQSPSV